MGEDAVSFRMKQTQPETNNSFYLVLR